MSMSAADAVPARAMIPAATTVRTNEFLSCMIICNSCETVLQDGRRVKKIHPESGRSLLQKKKPGEDFHLIRVDGWENSSGALDLLHFYPFTGFGGFEHGVRDVIGGQTGLEGRLSRFATFNALDEVGHVMDEAVLVSDL